MAHSSQARSAVGSSHPHPCRHRRIPAAPRSTPVRQVGRRPSLKSFTPHNPQSSKRCARVAVTLFLAPYRARYLPAYPTLKRCSPLNHHLLTLTRFALPFNPSETNRQAASHGRVIEKSLKASCKTANKSVSG